MKLITAGLYQSELDHPFDNVVQSAAYFLRRERGNLLVYSSRHIAKHFDFIRGCGGIVNQMLNHRDEASEVCDLVSDEFDAPLICHELEKPEIEMTCRVGGTVRDGDLFSDLAVIHTPGHCPGSACYLWRRGDENLLFTGDTFYPNQGSWLVAIGDGQQREMIASLKRLLAFEVDWLVPGLFIGEVAVAKMTSRSHYESLIGSCIDRLERGATH